MSSSGDVDSRSVLTVVDGRDDMITRWKFQQTPIWLYPSCCEVSDMLLIKLKAYMKLSGEIVDLLMHEDGSLGEALLKTKVLLSQIGQRDLVGWISNEITGYGEAAEVPEYRAVHEREFTGTSLTAISAELGEQYDGVGDRCLLEFRAWRRRRTADIGATTVLRNLAGGVCQRPFSL